MSKLQSTLFWLTIGLLFGAFFGFLFDQFQYWAFGGVLAGAVYGYFLGSEV